jgi:hypothetical protein
MRVRVLPLSVALTMAVAMSTAAQEMSSHAHENDMLDGRWGHGHAENHDWYKNLKQPGTGYSCCNGTADGVAGDCRPTRAYRTEQGTWRALLDGQWTPIPPSVVLKMEAPDGNSHICAGKSGMVYCFIGGVPKS